MIGMTFSRYRILGDLGKGGMGQVYLAEDTTLGRQVAIKFPKSDVATYKARFLGEARAASKLQHPNIAQIFDYGETSDGRPFLVMELVTGEDLNQILKKGPLAPEKAAEVTAGLLAALQEAHRHHLIHRDIKPSNIMISDRGEIKVLDFGLAKYVPDAGGQAGSDIDTVSMGQTAPGAAVGTPLFMSPEQVRGLRVDARTDVFSAGLVLYECLTGKAAFRAKTKADVLALVLHGTPVRPSTLAPGVSPRLDAITMKAIEKDPAARYQSASEMMADLNAGAESRSRSSTFSAVVENTSAFLHREPRKIAAAVAAVVIAAALLVTFVPASHQPTQEAMQWYTEGRNALRDGTYLKASRALQRAVTLDGLFALAHARLAEAWSELEYSDKAREEMLRAQAVSGGRGWFENSESLYMEAVNRTLTRDFEGAIARYTKIAAKAQDTEKAQTLVDLGRAYEKNEQTQQALKAYSESVRLNPQYPAAFLRQGILYGRLQKTTDAETAFAKAETLYQALSNLEGQTEVLIQRGVLANKARKLDQAWAHFERAQIMARTTGSEYQQIAAMLQLSGVAQTLGNTEKARQLANEGIVLARRSGIGLLETRGLIDLGNAHFVHGEYAGAEARFLEAQEAARRSSMRRQEARATFSLGSLHIQQSKSGEGLAEIEAARSFFEPGGYRQETGQCLALIGRVQRQMGNLDAALAGFDRLRALGEQYKDVQLTQLALSGRAGTLSDREAYPQALDDWVAAKRGSPSVQDPTSVFFATIGTAKVLWRLGRYEQARKELASAEAQADAKGGPRNPLWAWSIALNLAEMADSQRELLEAVSAGRQALKLAGGQVGRVVSVKSVLGLALAHSGAHAEAKKLVQEALAGAPADDAAQVALIRLNLAEVHLAGGDSPAALAEGIKALEEFRRQHRTASAFRAATIALMAAGKADPGQQRDYGRQAAILLTELESILGDKDFAGFTARPDMQGFIAHTRQFQFSQIKQ